MDLKKAAAGLYYRISNNRKMGLKINLFEGRCYTGQHLIILAEQFCTQGVKQAGEPVDVVL